MSSSSTLSRLQAWYLGRANGTWEHAYGVHIETLDNPGWAVTIDVADTHYANEAFPEFRHKYEHDADWFQCRKVGTKLQGVGGPEQLEAILQHLLAWLERAPAGA